MGRGCLAGPVFAAAVIFNSTKDIRKYKDSKALTQEQRTELSLSIHAHHIVGIGWASVEEIDSINILQASFLAMHRAVTALNIVEAGTILVDGILPIPDISRHQQLPIVKGDVYVRLISAASIAAKVARDQFMTKLAEEVNLYGFEKHKGYGTLYHREQIQKNGPCRWHRQSFSGVKEYIVQPTV
ncbi:MAG: ribonuclease HII [Bdellovibrio sp.]|nr:ribonuclease HII [Bdellovibrio sp.]